MVWRRVVGAAFVACSFAAQGCETEGCFVRKPADPVPAPVAVAQAAATETPSGVRGQKPDLAKAQPVSFIDMPPDRPLDAGDSRPAATICAVVNNAAILDEEVRSFCFQALMQARQLPEPQRTEQTKQIFAEGLDQLIERELVLQDFYASFLGDGNNKGREEVVKRIEEAARKQFDSTIFRNMKAQTGCKTELELKRLLSSQGLSLTLLRRQHERQFIKTEYLRNKIWPTIDREGTHVKVVQYYDTHPEEFTVGESVEWQDLFVSLVSSTKNSFVSREAGKNFAEVLVRRAQKGEDFTKLVEQYDDGLSADGKGGGVGHKRGEIRPAELEDTLFAMKDGEVKMKEFENGFHIYRVVKHQQAGVLPFDEKLQKQITNKLKNAAIDREIKRLIKSLREKAVIEVRKTV